MAWLRWLLPPASLIVLVVSPAAFGLCRQDLARALQQEIQNPQWQRGQWGMVVRDLTTGDLLYDYQGEKLFLVASNVKLTTVAAALDYWGANHFFETTLSARSPDRTTLRLQGSFDPSFSSQDLQQMALRLSQQGIRQIPILEIGGVTPVRMEPTWAIEDLTMGYAAVVTRFSLNQNALNLEVIPQQLGQPLALRQPQTHFRVVNETRTVTPSEPEFLESEVRGQQIIVRGQLHIGSEPAKLRIPLSEPIPYLQQQVQRAFAQAGIQVQQIRLVETAEPLPNVLVRHASPPLEALILPVLQESDNFYAEMLLAALEAAQPGYRQRYLERIGVQAAVLVDGSGLSRQNWLTPNGLVTLLQHITQTKDASLWRRSLPLAGRSGTLRQRFRDTAAQDRVWAKTGTLRGVVALAGYVEPLQDRPFVFSLVVNQGGEATAQLRAGLDRIVVLLAQSQNCPHRP
ncbi:MULTISPECIES: D-alanyl-D-alanine carboxypeptidase/D-alanyl-D-alanine-endopeptidase [unclassified Thermosynechococcus]|uniref:D-alanyl-D-alanine carboxypeptidase/D-alanyl-D-alanine endopeptidase n=1 Tax=unclassified Thermosynechococcus TaxID=2622553 RepID=UPI002872F3D7|nr:MULTISPECIES: D-alanyl-D-alanine carboxypeptidase/D-alanyl-D-alanine-endopeptidase [unclassified Thermosynechococcus]WNC33228.1 D-alanyl-D-alanine carboxypeptidase/D-alanyl-D-alanine-endopeptidase [Thermosynechococcus sp. PKX95]WNC35752.1 D-alanyl-D-alanine carboxypeptidase/D-alanyl-D-alanine-endopeptidase [Thermosynechococcus sp. PKX91]WNC38276.1 D-alanyl-D-alanine carboxypeptidase/D-alanyl-D-alanine-endopeptidase [Thermosynechococcus sp. WL11]WNC40795.1 D-alanyl-D-alanine carboxypeptidase/